MSEEKTEVKGERCQNPWKHNPKCENTDIQLTIQLTKKTRKGLETTSYLICRDCWEKISKSNKEWGTEPHRPLKLGLSEEDMKTLTVMDTMQIGKPKKGEVIPDEDDEDVY